MNEDRIVLLEKAIIGINIEFEELKERHNRTLHVQYEIAKFRRKRKAEREIKKLLKYKIIPILQKLDLKKMDIWYNDVEKFRKALKHIKKALEGIDEWGF